MHTITRTLARAWMLRRTCWPKSASCISISVMIAPPPIARRPFADIKKPPKQWSAGALCRGTGATCAVADVYIIIIITIYCCCACTCVLCILHSSSRALSTAPFSRGRSRFGGGRKKNRRYNKMIDCDAIRSFTASRARVRRKLHDSVRWLQHCNQCLLSSGMY